MRLNNIKKRYIVLILLLLLGGLAGTAHSRLSITNCPPHQHGDRWDIIFVSFFVRFNGVYLEHIFRYYAELDYKCNYRCFVRYAKYTGDL